MPQELLQDKYLQKIPGGSCRGRNGMPNLFFEGTECRYLPLYNREYIKSFTGKNGEKYTDKGTRGSFPDVFRSHSAAQDMESAGLIRRNRNIVRIRLCGNDTGEELLKGFWKVQEIKFPARNNKIEIKSGVREGGRGKTTGSESGFVRYSPCGLLHRNRMCGSGL